MEDDNGDGTVYVWAYRSEVHRGEVRNGVLLVPEACNTDEMAGTRVVVRNGVLLVPADRKPCRRCFPDGELPE